MKPITSAQIKRWESLPGFTDLGEGVRSFMLGWHPAKWVWDVEEHREQIKALGYFLTQWTCVNQTAKVGDRFYMARVGVEPCGIIGAGEIVGAPFKDAQLTEGLATVRVCQLRVSSLCGRRYAKVGAEGRWFEILVPGI